MEACLCLPLGLLPQFHPNGDEYPDPFLRIASQSGADPQSVLLHSIKAETSSGKSVLGKNALPNAQTVEVVLTLAPGLNSVGPA